MFGRRASNPQGPGDHGVQSPIGMRPAVRSIEAAVADHPAGSAHLVGPAITSDSPIQKLRVTFNRIRARIYDRIDSASAARLSPLELRAQIEHLIAEIIDEQHIILHGKERAALIEFIIDDMTGLGPLEALLRDDTISDIMVNGPKQIYIERRGKLELTDVQFRDNAHVMNVAQRIVTRVGRRVDEACPICDARLEDGSRVNIIATPLAIDGCCISIRKFAKRSITLDTMVQQGTMTESLATVLRVAAACRLNIVISGGTGSGKTTLLNALSQQIDSSERVVTIEDAAELRLQQPHVVRLETRPPNLEGQGEISIRDLVRNALRMRPDRIICGEVRGGEALDMLQAMNTGHDGSMCTLHANNPREATTRIENMVSLATSNLSTRVIRAQIAGAINLFIQVTRLRDGRRGITQLSEVVGMEGEVITLQDLLIPRQEVGSVDPLAPHCELLPVKPRFSKKAAYYGLERMLLQALKLQ